jgi:hypothetical protein
MCAKKRVVLIASRSRCALTCNRKAHDPAERATEEEMLETIRSFPTLPTGIFEVGRRYGIQATDGFSPFL